MIVTATFFLKIMTIYLLTRLEELEFSLALECAEEACYQSHHVAKRGEMEKMC